jgi:tight adherence protein C
MLLPVLIFLAVTLALTALFVWLLPSRAEQRLQAVAPIADDARNWTETLVRVTGPFAKLTVPAGDWETSPLRLRFLNAGLRHPDLRLLYFSTKGLLPLVFAGFTFFAVRVSGNMSGLQLLLVMTTAALVGCYLPNFVLSVLAQRRQREIFENFPDAADLMLVCVEAGLGLDAALTHVADEMRRKSVAMAEEIQLTNLEMRAGGTREAALRNLALRTGVEETGTFATMLTQADRFGTSISESLRVFSDDLRHKRRVRAEERAAKIPTKMLIPMVLCIFPSVVMVVMGPAIIQIVRVVGPMLAGGK